MLYLMDKFDLEIIKVNKNSNIIFDLWETCAKRVQRWMENERCRSIFSRQEIINLFKTKHKIQMVQIKEIVLKKYDKIILWTNANRYFILEVKNIQK